MYFELTHTNKPKTLAVLNHDRSVVKIGTDLEKNKLVKFLEILNTLAIRIDRERTIYAHVTFNLTEVRITLSANSEQPEANDVTYIQKL